MVGGDCRCTDGCLVLAGKVCRSAGHITYLEEIP
jgi:hypothetical protein